MSRRTDKSTKAKSEAGTSATVEAGTNRWSIAKARLFDASIVGTPQEAIDFITNILESYTEYSVIAQAVKDYERVASSANPAGAS